MSTPIARDGLDESADGSRKIVYVSALVSQESFARYFDAGRTVPSIAAQKFHRLLVEGLTLEARTSEVVVVGAPPISRAVTPTLLHGRHVSRQEGAKYVSLPFINLPLLRQVAILVSAAATILQETRHDDAVVVCDVLCGAPSIAALAARALTGRPTLGVVTDVPLRRPRVGSLRRRVISRLAGILNTAWLGSFDGYLLLTAAMNDVVNPKNRPHVIIEGLVDSNQAPALPRSGRQDPRILLYTGSTHRVYGLPMLVEAFLAADLEDWELHICGHGDYDAELRRLSAGNPRIRFFGVVDNQTAVRQQLEADVLVNPRPTGAEFTKYSFPSKNMEYMASGRPLLTTRLPGMPPDYLPHVLLFDQETASGYCETLRDVAAMDPRRLDELGAGARDFVFQRKNKQVQASRFLDLVDGTEVQDRH